VLILIASSAAYWKHCIANLVRMLACLSRLSSSLRLSPVSDLHRSGLVQYMFCDLNISRHESDVRQKARSLFSNCIKSISGRGGRWWPQLPSRVKPTAFKGSNKIVPTICCHKKESPPIGRAKFREKSVP
jgi:hypothetical protein